MMYFINLTLQAEESEYENLTDVIKTLGPWSNRLKGTWLVEARLSSRQIRDLLKGHMKPGDRIFVGQFERNWAGTNMGEGFPEWMERRNFTFETQATASE